MKKHNEMDESMIREGLRGYKPKSDRFDEIWENIRANRSAYSTRGNRRHMEKIIVCYAGVATVFLLSITVGAGLWSKYSAGKQPVETTLGDGYDPSSPSVEKVIRGDKEGVDALFETGLLHDDVNPADVYRMHNDALDAQDKYQVYQIFGAQPFVFVCSPEENYESNMEMGIDRCADAEDGEEYFQSIYYQANYFQDAVFADLDKDGKAELILSAKTHYHMTESRPAKGESNTEDYDRTFFWIVGNLPYPRYEETPEENALLFGSGGIGSIPVQKCVIKSSDVDQRGEKQGFETVYTVGEKCGELHCRGGVYIYHEILPIDPAVMENATWGDREGVEEFVRLLNAGGAWEYDPMNRLGTLKDKLNYQYNKTYSAENILRIHTVDLEGQDEFAVYQQYGDEPMAWVLYRGETIYPLMSWSPYDGYPSMGREYPLYSATIPLAFYDITLAEPRGDGSRDLLVMAYSKRTVYTVDWHSDDTKEYYFEDGKEFVCVYQFNPNTKNYRIINSTVISNYDRETGIYDIPYCAFGQTLDNGQRIEVMNALTASSNIWFGGEFVFDHMPYSRYGYLEYCPRGGEWDSDYWEFVMAPDPEPTIPPETVEKEEGVLSSSEFPLKVEGQYRTARVSVLEQGDETALRMEILNEDGSVLCSKIWNDPGFITVTTETKMDPDASEYFGVVNVTHFDTDKDQYVYAYYTVCTVHDGEIVSMNVDKKTAKVTYVPVESRCDYCIKTYLSTPASVKKNKNQVHTGFTLIIDLMDPNSRVVADSLFADQPYTCTYEESSMDRHALGFMSEKFIDYLIAYAEKVFPGGTTAPEPSLTDPAPTDPPASPGSGKVTSVAPGPDPDTIIEDGFLYSLSEGGNFYYIVEIGSYKGGEHLVIPGSYNGLPTAIYPDAFHGLEGLVSVTIEEGVLSIGHRAFRNIGSLTSVTIPSSVDTIGDGAFSGCVNLQNVTISQGVRKIGQGAFEGVESLENITIPASVEIIAEQAFWGCDKLESVTILSSDTLRIGNDVFSHCASLKSVTLPKCMERIGAGNFSDCPNLTDIYFGGSQAEWERADSGIVIDERTTVHFAE